MCSMLASLSVNGTILHLNRNVISRAIIKVGDIYNKLIGHEVVTRNPNINLVHDHHTVRLKLLSPEEFDNVMEWPPVPELATNIII